MKHRILILIFFTFFLSNVKTFAEGSKEIGDYTATNGGLRMTTEVGRFPFGLYNAPDADQIKFRINNLSEFVYYGMQIRASGGTTTVPPRNTPYRIKDPNGTIVFTGNVPTVGQIGYINSFAEADTGPDPLNTGPGYTPLFFKPTMLGDYVIEFNPVFTPVITGYLLRYFDLSVMNAANQPILGRLHCKSWQISAGSFTTPIRTIVYPYHPEGVVYKVDLNQMSPFVFNVFLNSFGTQNTGNFEEDRKSRIGQFTIPEFEVFLNPPDETSYPIKTGFIDYTASLRVSGCEKSLFCLDFRNSTTGVVDGFIDFNLNNIYEPTLGDIEFSDLIDSTGRTCIEWNGLDALGNPIGRGKINLVTRIGSGITHLPLYDIEHNPNGYKVQIHKPTILPNPTIFWDDSEITKGNTLGTPKVELNGCNSTPTTGCHAWIDRGEINGDRTKQETINTWWFSQIEFDTIVFDYIPNNPVEASFSPSTLVKTHPIICEGDSVSFYVYNNNENHYDPTRYFYEWYAGNPNGTPIANDVNTIRIAPKQSTKIYIKSIFKLNPGCISMDSIDIRVVNPTKGIVDVNDTICVDNIAEARISYTTNQLFPQIIWDQFPGFNGSERLNLLTGTYTVRVVDNTVNAQCAWDTTFSVKANTKIQIENIVNDSTLCYQTTGDIRVSMVSKTQPYVYSWNNTAFQANPFLNNQRAGDYNLQVRDALYGCMLDTVIPIKPLPFNILATSKNELCGDNTGQITVSAPSSPNLSVLWNDSPTTSLNRTGLGFGTYTVQVFSNLVANCSVDTTITINDSVPFISLIASFERNNLVRQKQFVCIEDSVIFYVFNDGVFHYNDTNFDYRWYVNDLSSGTFASNVDSIKIVPMGQTTIFVEAISTVLPQCRVLDSLEIDVANPIQVVLDVNDTICVENIATASITFNSNQNTTIQWNQFPGFTGNSRNDLKAGTYTIRVADANYSAQCAWDSTFTVKANNKIEIERLIKDSTFCYESTGDIGVVMVNKSLNYEFSWNNSPFQSDSLLFNQQAGNYLLTVRDSLYKCTLDTNIQLKSLPFAVGVDIVQDLCTQSLGSIEVIRPSTSLIVSWSDSPTNNPLRDNILTGNYSFTVTSPLDVNCRVDSTVFIGDTVPTTVFKLSYDSINLVRNNNFICTEDTIDFFIHKDGVDHYDDVKFTYYWFLNDFNNPIDTNERLVSLVANSNFKILARTVLIPNTACVNEDSLLIQVSEPLQPTLTVKDTICTENRAEVSISYSSLQNPNVIWDQFPGFNGLTKTDLTQGTYTVRLQDPNFAARCAWDTTFSVNANKFIAIDRIFGGSTFCYDSSANVGVSMVNQSQKYEFAWNNNPYGDDSLQFNLPAGNYPVKIRDSILGCELDTLVAVTSVPFTLNARLDNEECNDSTGRIMLQNIIPKMTVLWLDNGSNDTVRDNLKSGNYPLRITTGIVGCSIDTILKINLTIPDYSRLYASFDRAFFIRNLQSICQQDSVTFHVWEDGQDHYNDFFWHYEWYRGDTLSTPIAQDTTSITLAPNDGEKIYIKSFLRVNQNCFLTDSLEVNVVQPLSPTLIVVDTICTENRATAKIELVTEQNPIITWTQFPDFNGTERTDLTNGQYSIQIRDANFSDQCAWDTTFNVMANHLIRFDKVIGDTIICYDSSGVLIATMENKNRTYQFNWNALGFVDGLDTIIDQTPGTYSVIVRDSMIGCTLDTTLQILATPFDITIATIDEECNDSSGSITLGLPKNFLNLTWSDFNNNNLSQSPLSSDTFRFSIIHNNSATCRIDSFAVVKNVTPNYSPLQLSFDPNNLVKTIPFACETETVGYFIHNDGISHYNDANFQYSWYLNDTLSLPFQTDIRQFIHIPVVDEKIIVKAVYQANTNCQLFDSLEMKVFEPIKPTLIVQDSNCTANVATATVLYNTNQNPTVVWTEFPLFFDSLKTDLTNGTYTITVIDSLISIACSWDTTFSVNANYRLAFDTTFTNNTLCYDSTGKVGFELENKTQPYLITWDDITESNIFQRDSLISGNYTVNVKDTIFGCEIDTLLPVNSLPIQFTSEVVALTCEDSTGYIKLNLPSQKLSVNWSDIPDMPTIRRSLFAGNYQVKVFHFNGSDTVCSVDTSFRILAENRPFSFEKVEVKNTDCVKNTGSVEVSINKFGENSNYVISYNKGQNYTNNFTKNDFGIGVFPIYVREIGTQCKIDTTIEIKGEGHDLDLKITNALCDSAIGSVDINITNPDYAIFYSDAPGIADFKRSNLAPGNYVFQLENINHPECNLVTSFNIGKDDNNLKADFKIDGYVFNDQAYSQDSLRFINTSDPLNTPIINWNFGDGTSTNVQNPVHYYTDQNEYEVKLYIEDIYGCKDELVRKLKIEEFRDCKMVMPNAFSPNGDDYNDNIGVLGNGDDMELKIYNRWGELIFLSESLSERWNGDFLSQQSPVGIYVYLLDYSCTDLRGKYTKKNEVGEVTLVR